MKQRKPTVISDAEALRFKREAGHAAAEQVALEIRGLPPDTRKLLEFMRANPGMTLTAAGETTRLSRKALKAHYERLLDLGLLPA